MKTPSSFKQFTSTKSAEQPLLNADYQSKDGKDVATAIQVGSATATKKKKKMK